MIFLHTGQYEASAQAHFVNPAFEIIMECSLDENFDNFGFFSPDGDQISVFPVSIVPACILLSQYGHVIR